VVATAEVTTLAGAPFAFGSADGVGEQAQFSTPVGLVADGAGSLFVVDGSNNTVRRIDIATAQVTTLVGTADVFGNADGVGPAAQFLFPSDVDFDGAGNLYVADTSNHVVRKIEIATATVTTVVGQKTVSGVLPGALPARLSFPRAVATLPGGRLAVIDENAVLVATF